MRSFAGIAAAKDTSLAVVAPGIAEALFATGIGLAAAIPAVIFYNQANVALDRLAERMHAAVARFAKAQVYGHGRGPSRLRRFTQRVVIPAKRSASRDRKNGGASVCSDPG